MYYTTLLSLILVLRTTIALTVPIDVRDLAESNAYSGAGGQAPGGSVNGGQSPKDHHGLGTLINVLSNNAGNGGDSSSGSATSSGPGPNIKGHQTWGHDGSFGNAFSGAGGNAAGGSVNNVDPGLINVLSGNAGGGGDASSGSSKAGHPCDC